MGKFQDAIKDGDHEAINTDIDTVADAIDALSECNEMDNYAAEFGTLDCSRRDLVRAGIAGSLLIKSVATTASVAVAADGLTATDTATIDTGGQPQAMRVTEDISRRLEVNNTEKDNLSHH